MREDNISQDDWVSSSDFREDNFRMVLRYAFLLLVSCGVGAGVLTLIGKSLEG